MISRREIGDFWVISRREISTVHTAMISRREIADFSPRYRRENKWTNRASRDQSCDWPWHLWILDNGRPPMKTNRLYSHKFVVTCQIDCMWATDSYTWKLSPAENDEYGWGAMYNYYTEYTGIMYNYNDIYITINSPYRADSSLNKLLLLCIIIPNTAVFGPTNFIGTTIASTASTARMKISTARMKISTVAGRGH